MPGGYTGKILRVNLTTKQVSTLPTEKYMDFGGGHGMGSAIFFDLVGSQLPFEAFDPRNLIIMMASPFAGTFMPGSGRCEVQSLAPMLYPIEWFGHSNFGGRFTAQLKFAGWDGIVVEGASDAPVYISVVNDQVKIEDAQGVWGMDTWDAQQEISRRVVPSLKYGEWAELAQNCFSTQIPAVVACGPAGERKVRIAALLHGPGSQAALCGFGAVFGSKNLKAISVIGNGGVPIADPQALMDARIWFRQFQFDVDEPRDAAMIFGASYSLISGAPSGGNVSNGDRVPARAAACASCPRGCKQRLATADSNEAVCAGTMWGRVGGGGMFGAAKAKPGAAPAGLPAAMNSKLTRQANDLMHRMGIGHWALMATQGYINAAINNGWVKAAPLPPQGTFAYSEALLRLIAAREGEIGELAAEGPSRMAEKLGRYQEDVQGGNNGMRLTYWGTQEHYGTLSQLEWGYGSLFGERDLMLHQMSNYPLHWMAISGNPYASAEEASKIYSEAMIPYQDDRYLVDYGLSEKTGIYSDSKIRLTAWTKHYEKMWHGMGFCGWRWPQCITNNTADRRGATPNAEPRFWNAITGQKMTFADSMEMGHKIFTLDRAIWNIQGRTKAMEVFPDWIYDRGTGNDQQPLVDEEGKWVYGNTGDRKHDRAKFEDFKTRFYKFEGWNPDNSYPTRATLEKMGMKNVADVLQSKGKLG
jgi:aldehyde:ferredoxin oxidoreductase